MTAHPEILVPRLMDENNRNAQNLNASAMLARFRSDVRWRALHCGAPHPEVQSSPHVRLQKLWRGHLEPWHHAFCYLGHADAIFYPGVEWHEALGLRARRKLRPSAPIVTTLEALPGDEEREERLRSWAEHDVFCDRVTRDVLARIDRLHEAAAHIIAISPFLAAMGRRLYGDKLSCQPLGVDRRLFHANGRAQPARTRIVAAGRLSARKRPELFIKLAREFPDSDFVWFGGDGATLERYRAQAAGISNLTLPGPVVPAKLADEFRQSSVFVLPSKAEGVPKVTQEAAACGLPLVVFGHYEPPTVRDGVNGYVVWTDDELIARTGELIGNRARAAAMGRESLLMAEAWGWDLVAPQWERRILAAAGLNDGGIARTGGVYERVAAP